MVLGLWAEWPLARRPLPAPLSSSVEQTQGAVGMFESALLKEGEDSVRRGPCAHGPCLAFWGPWAHAASVRRRASWERTRAGRAHISK